MSSTKNTFGLYPCICCIQLILTLTIVGDTVVIVRRTLLWHVVMYYSLSTRNVYCYQFTLLLIQLLVWVFLHWLCLARRGVCCRSSSVKPCSFLQGTKKACAQVSNLTCFSFSVLHNCWWFYLSQFPILSMSNYGRSNYLEYVELLRCS